MSVSLPAVLVDCAWLKAHLEDAQLVILDATVDLPAPRFDGDYRVNSGHAGWAQAHIPTAQHADLLSALAATEASFTFAMPTTEQLLAALAVLGVSDGKTVVIYDRADGFWAARLWWMLRSVGMQAAVLDGGFAAWQRTGGPTASTGQTAVTSAQAGTQPVPGVEDGQQSLRPRLLGEDAQRLFWVDQAQVESVVAGRTPGTLLCALGKAVFDGTAPTRYARRGHIPGSRNLPARALFDEHGFYLPKDALARLLAPFLHEDGPLILYCGGGISAAATALALTLLGCQQVALYDGSLQEWAADARLPMTTGAAPA